MVLTTESEVAMVLMSESKVAVALMTIHLHVL